MMYYTKIPSCDWMPLGAVLLQECIFTHSPPTWGILTGTQGFKVPPFQTKTDLRFCRMLTHQLAWLYQAMSADGHLLLSLPRLKDFAVKVRFCQRLPTLNYVESRQEIIMWHLQCHQVLAKLYPAGPCDCYLMSECEWQWALARGQQQHGAVVGHESGIMKQ